MNTAAGSDLEDAAARWAVRLDGGPLSPVEQSALDAWLQQDDRRSGALLRAEASLAYLDRGRALAAPHGCEDAPERPGFLSRRRLLGFGAMGVLAAAGIAAALITGTPAPEIRTAIGEVRRVPLADGSAASINTASVITVAMSPTRREVELKEGEAWFQVAHDKARPFIVEAGDVRVQAVGTAFSVRRRDGGADVLVTDGIVEAWLVGHEGMRTRIGAGSKGFLAAGTEMTVSRVPAQVDRQLAWRTGELALNGESLDYAVREFNRYNRRQLVVGDPTLGREPLVGYFRTNQPEEFGRATAKLLGARAVVTEDGIELMR